MKNPAIRVKRPRARRLPPRVSERPAAHAKKAGNGNPRPAVPSTRRSDGGIFPTPCAIASETPAKIRSSARPAFADRERPDSPPNSACLNIYFLRNRFYFVVKEWHNLDSKTKAAGERNTVNMGDIDLAYLVSHLVIFMVVLLLAVSVHEAGHAWMSYKFGDDTAYMLGRVTLNPVAHTDPIGTLLIPIIAFLLGTMGGALGSIPLIGWGKPTPVNPRKWDRYKLANVMVSIAGVLANLILLAIGIIAAKIMMSQGFQIADFFRGPNPLAIFVGQLML